ncbi:MAG: glutaredoxin 3 [Halioglobus sp.]|nr:glutaredoxin 3 [Halioglobus sp.]
MSQGVTMYTTQFCPYCVRARSLLDSKGIAYEDIAVDHDPGLRLEMATRSGRNTVPQIWIGEQHIGGCDEMMMLERQGRLDDMLARAGTAPRTI